MEQRFYILQISEIFRRELKTENKKKGHPRRMTFFSHKKNYYLTKNF